MDIFPIQYIIFCEDMDFFQETDKRIKESFLTCKTYIQHIYMCYTLIEQTQITILLHLLSGEKAK